MIDMNEVSSIHRAGFNCAQVVACLCRDISGVDGKTAKAAMGGFGGGARCGEMCGAVSGGVFSLGMRFPYDEVGDEKAKKKIANLTVRFTSEFKEKYGCIACRDLLEKHGRPRCEEYMAYAAQLAHELVQQEKE